MFLENKYLNGQVSLGTILPMKAWVKFSDRTKIWRDFSIPFLNIFIYLINSKLHQHFFHLFWTCLVGLSPKLTRWNIDNLILFNSAFYSQTQLWFWRPHLSNLILSLNISQPWHKETNLHFSLDIYGWTMLNDLAQM